MGVLEDNIGKYLLKMLIILFLVYIIYVEKLYLLIV